MRPAGHSFRTIRRLAVCTVLGTLLLGDARETAAMDSDTRDDIAELIRARIQPATARRTASFLVGDDRLSAARDLPGFYRGRAFEPAWVTGSGLRPAADSLLWAVEGAILEGLDPAHYHLFEIRDRHAELRRAHRSGRPVPAERLVDLDLLLTDAFLSYASDLSRGRVDPRTVHPEWNLTRPAADLVAELDMALATGRVGATLDGLRPVHTGYERLRGALADYRRVAAQGGWPTLPGRTLRPGVRDPAVALLRERLRLSGDLESRPRRGRDQVYDREVEEAVRRFQLRHNLEPDGVVRLETSGYLNVSVEDRIRQIERNMERWRWMPRDLGNRHIIVNIAGFEMHVMEGDSSIFHSRVLAGQRFRRTPVFSDRMTFLVLNPTWTIPPGILEEDKLPLIRQDVGYLERNNIRVLAANGRVVDPSTINFERLTGATGYRFRMDPGPENPLGRVKFMFPNSHHIYLHDTPDHEHFDLTWGAVSSGCVRVERSMDLAEFLLAGASGWDRKRIEAQAVSGPVEQRVNLPRPLPIHILYWTSWVEPDGSVQFRSDVYDLDGLLDEGLGLAPTAPPVRAAATPS
jgi:L,D-transpeptidase YcbB